LPKKYWYQRKPQSLNLMEQIKNIITVLLMSWAPTMMKRVVSLGASPTKGT
jgi:hypothetical protein